ncbi:YdcF family protein [Patescibacteria group bacterium]|nr:YdcF family protein [Patescibacteria group bacterium]
MIDKLIPRRIALPKLTSKEIKIIGKTFFYQDPLESVQLLDLLFVFGVTKQIHECAKYISTIIDNDFKGSLVITGGIPNYSRKVLDKPQADMLFSKIKPKENLNLVALERKSVNTYENVTFSLNLIKFDTFKKIGIITNNLHSLRAYLTMRNFTSRNIKVLRYSYTDVDLEKHKKMSSINWIKSATFSECVASEIKRIKVYGKRGHINLNLARKMLSNELIDKF